MTVIAWDGVTLAADKKRTLYRTPMPAVKIFRARRLRKNGEPDGPGYLLYGCSGDSYDCIAFQAWVHGGPKPVLTSIMVMAIDEARRVWVAEEKLIWAQIPLKKFAIGSGADYALGAMLAGASAAKAVRITAEVDNSTGMGVNTLKFRA